MEIEFRCGEKKVLVVDLDCVPRRNDLFTYKSILYSVHNVGWGFRKDEAQQARLNKPYVAIELNVENLL